MKLAYNIGLPTVHILAVLGLLVAGFARMMAWACWFWVNDLVYILLAGIVMTGHWVALSLGRRHELQNVTVLRAVATLDYILFSLQLALVIAWLVWEAGAPFLSDSKTFSWLVVVALVPVAMVDLVALVLRLYSVKEFIPDKKDDAA